MECDSDLCLLFSPQQDRDGRIPHVNIWVNIPLAECGCTVGGALHGSAGFLTWH